MDKSEVVKFWLEGANEDWEFSVEVWKSGKHLYNALFFAHLSMEKTLKALHYEKKGDHPLLTHDLVLLARKLDLSIDADKERDFREITSFNISARYDDYKKAFRLKATKDYVDLWMNKTEKLRNCLLELFERV